MYCGSCGTKNEDDAVVCANCGAPLGAQNEQADRTPSSAAPHMTAQGAASQTTVFGGKMSRDRLVGIVAVAVVVILVLVLIRNVFGGRSYETVAEKYISATYDVKAKTIVNLMPGDVVDYAMSEMNADTKSELIEVLNTALQTQIDSFRSNYGIDDGVTIKVSDFEFEDIEDKTDSEVDSLNSRYESYGYDVNISAGKEFTVCYVLTAGDRVFDCKNTIEVIKIGNKWYIDVLAMY